MGIYVYKVTGKKVTLADGTRANVAVFAYNPWGGYSEEAERRNNRAYRESGCPRAAAYTKLPGYTGRVVIGEEGDIAIETTVGVFTDAWFDMQVNKMRKEAKNVETVD